MPLCQNCKYEELEGALFCSECGSQLIHSQAASSDIKDDTQMNQLTDSEDMPVDNEIFSPLSSFPEGTANIVLHIFHTGDIIPLENSQQFTIGRVTFDQPIIPDIDLSPYDAFEYGVSRIHGTIMIEDDMVAFEDHGSANGTTVNDIRLESNRPYSLSHGDMITLGQFAMQILIRD